MERCVQEWLAGLSNNEVRAGARHKRVVRAHDRAQARQWLDVTVRVHAAVLEQIEHAPQVGADAVRPSRQREVSSSILWCVLRPDEGEALGVTVHDHLKVGVQSAPPLHHPRWRCRMKRRTIGIIGAAAREVNPLRNALWPGLRAIEQAV
eukprot:1056449-Prymnesium_polylepis.1